MSNQFADRYEDTTIETTDVGFTFAGGETEAANTKICIPHAEFPQGIWVNVVSNESTPFLIGLDVLREYGLVIDYHYKRVYSHILKTLFPLVQFFQQDILLWKCYRVTVNGDSTQWRVMPSRLDTGAGIQGHRRKERLHLSHDEKSEHEHGHTSTSEDGLLKLLNLPECTQTWTRFDKRAKTYRTTSSSGPFWENVVARITIDDETDHET